MSALLKIACDGCGLLFADSAPPWRKAALGPLRSAAKSAGWARCRPRLGASHRDYCPRCRPVRVPAILADPGPVHMSVYRDGDRTNYTPEIGS